MTQRTGAQIVRLLHLMLRLCAPGSWADDLSHSALWTAALQQCAAAILYTSQCVSEYWHDAFSCHLHSQHHLMLVFQVGSGVHVVSYVLCMLHQARL